MKQGAEIGVDLALVRNSTAFVAAYPGEIIRIGEVLELRPGRKTPLRLSEVVAEACDFAKRHGARILRSDHHVLEPAREHLREGFELKPVDASSDARIERFAKVRNLLNEGRIQIPGCYKRLALQLRDIVAKATPGGKTQIILRSRGAAHSDIAAAFVIAVWSAATPVRQIDRTCGGWVNPDGWHGLEGRIGPRNW